MADNNISVYTEVQVDNPTMTILKPNNTVEPHVYVNGMRHFKDHHYWDFTGSIEFKIPIVKGDQIILDYIL